MYSVKWLLIEIKLYFRNRFCQEPRSDVIAAFSNPFVYDTSA